MFTENRTNLQCHDILKPKQVHDIRVIEHSGQTDQFNLELPRDIFLLKTKDECPQTRKKAQLITYKRAEEKILKMVRKKFKKGGKQ